MYLKEHLTVNLYIYKRKKCVDSERKYKLFLVTLERKTYIIKLPRMSWYLTAP